MNGLLYLLEYLGGNYVRRFKKKNGLKFSIFFKQEYDIADVSFKTWILPLEVESFENNMITLVFPGESGKTGLQYINKKYLALLKISIEETLNQELELQIILPNETVSKIEDESSKISSVSQEDISF